MLSTVTGKVVVCPPLLMRVICPLYVWQGNGFRSKWPRSLSISLGLFLDAQVLDGFSALLVGTGTPRQGPDQYNLPYQDRV